MTPKVVVVMPAYNAGRTLRMTYAYGLRILALCAQYALHARGFARTSRFDSLRRRYTRLAPRSEPAPHLTSARLLSDHYPPSNV